MGEVVRVEVGSQKQDLKCRQASLEEVVRIDLDSTARSIESAN